MKGLKYAFVAVAFSSCAQAAIVTYGSDEEVFEAGATLAKALEEISAMPELELRSFAAYLAKCRGSFGFKNDLIEYSCREARLNFLIAYNQDRAVDRYIQSLQSVSDTMKTAIATKKVALFEKYLTTFLSREGELCRAANRRFRVLAKVPPKPTDDRYATALCYTD